MLGIATKALTLKTTVSGIRKIGKCGLRKICVGKTELKHPFEKPSFLTIASCYIRSTPLFSSYVNPYTTKIQSTSELILPYGVKRNRNYSTSFHSRRRPKTIYALSTPFGVSGICVIRVSGPSVKKVLEEMTRGGKRGEKRVSLPEPRIATLRTVVVPQYNREHAVDDKVSGKLRTELEQGEVIDEGIVVYYESGRSFTGEDMVEFQLHGGISVIRDTLEALSLVNNDMIEAEPGEFTKRAWANGKFEDLTRLEAVSDLIHSETRAQRKQAFLQLQGELGKLYTQWSTEIHTCLAHIEALVDFGHDELLDAEIVTSNIIPKVDTLIKHIESHLNDNGKGQLLRNGISVALVGPPNAGKSSLLNLLAERAYSIVSDEAGTTRDVVEAKIDLQGFPLILQDTAGLNTAETVGKIEREGIARAKDRFNFSAVKLVVIDINDRSHFNDVPLHQLVRDNPDSTIFVLNKVDSRKDAPGATHSSQNNPNFIDGKPNWIIEDPLFKTLPVIYTSCTTGVGLEELREQIAMTVKAALGKGAFIDGPVLTRQRHRENLKESLEALYRFKNCPVEHVEILAEELRLAGKSIARITGKVDVEQILDIVFKDFCIGK